MDRLAILISSLSLIGSCGNVVCIHTELDGILLLAPLQQHLKGSSPDCTPAIDLAYLSKLQG